MSKKHHHEHDQFNDKFKPAPLWKWIVIIALVVALPLFYAFIRTSQVRHAIYVSTPAANQAP